ncbi:uncharacterized protein LOC8056302 isoform X2 [Sorghum bicolor]|uniref:uncharacterized protein LOC8056302 isoform X2 n=1 Tax=Sorghum bicolor TaxID=4558 RepID=UPI000B424037|nr:uncharacterized protein LOC8056302 isoform X2 [Sorghum bicolor]|eukprot:XP_021316487.1 uncharacterized protein LOC8056302 isoform X2 [Sorghum bicolor]
MVPNGQIFDSSLEKGQPYIFRVGSGQVVLDVYPCRRGLTTNQRLSSGFDCWRSVVKFSFLCTSEHSQRSVVARAEPDVGRGHH